MTATSASALDIVSTGGFTAPLANELCLGDGGDPVLGVVSHEITLTQGGNFPQNLRIDVTLPANVEFADVNSSGSAVQGENVTAVETGTDASVQSGGTAGDQTVQFILSETNDSAETIAFDLPIAVTGCPDGSGIDFVLFDTQNNLFVEGDALVNSNEVSSPMAPMPTALPGCADGVVGELLADDPEKEIQLAVNSGSGVDYDTIGDNEVGSYEYTIDTSVAIDGAGNPITAAMILGVDWRVTVEDSTELLDATSSGGQSDTFGTGLIATANNEAFANGIARTIEINETGAGPIANQSVALRTALDFTVISGLEDKTPDTAMLDPLNREGVVFGRFDWVGSSNGAGTATVLRVTGLDTEEPTPYTVEVINTPNGEFDGIYSGTIPGDNDGEITLISTNLFGVDSPVNFVRGDMLICFETNETDVDVDRLLLRNGIVSAFNEAVKLAAFFLPYRYWS